jgi:hypothetical protein
MSESALHSWATWTEIILSGGVVVLLLFITAPYGRHDRPGWGPTIPNALGWVLMESPAVVLFTVIFLAGEHAVGTVPLVLGALWLFHYVQRTFVFPFRVRTKGKRMALVIVAMAFLFNTLNAYVVARWISHFGTYAASWLHDPRFIAGVLLFAAGFAINQHTDNVLIHLRAPGETGYKIPRGGLFDYVASPNYLGEMIEWFGFALATWSLAGLAFALFTAANIGPRAFANLRWYRSTFPDYPAERRALIPFVM